ncbi:Putative transcriptional regulator, AraC family [Cupriavidus taiwanensis]|nr:Putative transcriptional regulator, AraC family [Cupriavidus taiwanensis]SOZ25639.1 Putative transcriptional regulator, AraC family [Cupriavidus taiwanensis]SOZ44887.1 Putative transcriptional regulator, AraC family [Cupriavidus taiwanensis]SOZ98962.1 Putative transcriptional regulator, AraC family [Cupriavidus taiwanensis]
MAARTAVPQRGVSRPATKPAAPAAPAASCWWADAALPFAESRRASHSSASYLPHSHPTLSVGAVDGGTSRFACGDESAVLGPGAVVVIPAHQVHACNPVPDGRWSYQMLHFDPVWVAAVLDEDSAARAWLPARVMTSPEAYRLVCALNRTLFSPADSVEKEAALVAFIGDLHAALDAGATTWTLPIPAAVSARVAQLCQLLRERHAERLPLAELAQVCGLSRYHLVRAFRAETGMTPHAYQLDLRIQHGRRLLRQGAALAEVALALGFADQSHFQRAFKQRVAMTPRGYQRAA